MSDAPGCELTVTLRLPDRPPIVRTLTCDPVGGDHPHAAEACATLASLDDPFAPTPPGTVATMIYGGPQTATVDGHCGGVPVHASFSRTNGAEIFRWNRIAPLLDLEESPTGG